MVKMKKGSWPKPSLEMIAILADHMPRFKCEKKQMFGVPCYFVNGNMFTGVFSASIFARYSEEDRGILLREGLGEYFEPVKGRQMKEYRILSRKVIEDPLALDSWLDHSYTYVSSLIPKKK
jgi:TfoX/Sxy family transcriptional regulator of competence genes